jgi:hypothetical protein
MRRRHLARTTALATAGLAVVAGSAIAASADAHPHGASRHVLVLSVDGLHQSDLAWYVREHPSSALAALVHGGTEYTHAKTTFPSDSFPGMIAQFTGADPGTAGVYYDDTYNRTLLPPGTNDCSATPPGTEVPWTEAADRSHDPITLDAGQALSDPALTALSTNTKAQTLADHAAITKAILKMTPNPQALLDPASLPVDPATCLPVYPHRYLRVNTVFNVVRSAGLRTAWSDKHPAYEILNGPSGTGVEDLFTPEINSVADSAGDDWTTDNALTREYDDVKVAAVLNEIDGYDHSRTHHVGTPAVFGLNFQAVSTAEKLPKSDGLTGGYAADGSPGPLLRSALGYINVRVGTLMNRIKSDGLATTTTVVLSAKHGQSPIDPAELRRVDDGAIVAGLDAAWSAGHPGAAPLVAFSVDDDVMLLWLSDRRPAAENFARSYLLSHPAPANTVTDPKGTYSTSVQRSGLASVLLGAPADHAVGARTGDPHAPDVIGIVQHGVVYTGGVKKIAEHGGDSADDRDVPLVVWGAGARSGRVVSSPVLTTQIAPTTLALLGLDPHRLDGVRQDGTRVLPRV